MRYCPAVLLIGAVLAALFAPAIAGAAGAGSIAPLNPAYMETLVGSPVGAPSSAAVGQALGQSPGPQDYSYTRTLEIPGVGAFALPTSYDLRALGRVTSVKDQNPYGTCWSFAACGSLESCLLPAESRDFSEDNMVLTSGFNYPGSPYDAGGQIFMSTAYLVRWGGPVYEGDDAYGDAYTPAGLTPRKHVQEVDWLPVRSSALDNDGIKTAVRDHGAVDVSMGWYGSSSGSSYYSATTKSYYYNGSSSTNHEVLVVGWDDDYAAANFATAPAGNGAFIVKNSWGTGWGSNGYFYVSYYDSRFGRTTNPSAVFDQSEPTDNYSGIYQYDPLGDCAQYGFTNSTGWFANVFTAETTASLSAVGFYTVAPGTSYEVYTGSSLATKTLRTSGTEADMGYHTVTLPSPVTVTKGQPFTVAVKVTSPGASYPIAIETPFDNYSSGATASTGQSYVSLNGSSWSDITGTFSNTNVCLKAYVKAAGPGAISVTAPSGSTSQAQGTSLPVTWTTNAAVTTGQFSLWVVSPANGWYVGKIVAADSTSSYSNSVSLNVPVDGGYRVFVYYRAASGDPWGIYGFSPGTVNVSAVFNAITVTAPTGGGSQAQGSSLPVTWTTNAAVASGQFSIWVVSPGNGWYVGKIVAADGTASYTNSVTLNVPVDTGYRVYVYYRATTGDPWGIYGYSPGTVNVIAGFSSIAVTAPTGTSSQAQGSGLPVTWTTNQTVGSGQFSLWVVSPSNGWYVGKIVNADGTASYANSVTLNVPPDTGCRIFVYYRATTGDPWGLYGMSPGTVNVTAVFNAITVTAPTGGGSQAQGASLPVTWTTNQTVGSGQFSIWVVSPGNGWYVGKIVAADGTASYTNSVTLNVPVDTGYRIYVYYRATTGDPWGLYGMSPGTVNVTGP